MKIIDLDKEHEGEYFLCLEEWNPEIKEAADHKERWYGRIKERGLGVKLAINSENKAVGMIQYIPVEYSFVKGQELYFILCIWIVGYKEKGAGDWQKRGIGKALLQAAEDDIKKRGAKGVVAWGIPLPFWMRASWFRKQGYVTVDKDGFLGPQLLWKPFSADAQKPKWPKENKEPPLESGRVSVSCYISGWCPAYSMVCERARRATLEFGDKVIFNEIDTFGKDNRYGNSDSLYIDKKKIAFGPPLSYEKIKKKISRELDRNAVWWRRIF